MSDSLENELENKESSILTIITRDGKIQVSHTLARQISPMLGRFIDNWNKKDNSLYLNYSSAEVNKVLDEFNEPGSLKEFLLTGKGKSAIKFIDVIDNINKYVANMKIKITPCSVAIIRNYEKYVLLADKYNLYITINEKTVIYLFARLNKDIYLCQFNPTLLEYITLCSPEENLHKKVAEKNMDIVRERMTTLFNNMPQLLESFFPLN